MPNTYTTTAGDTWDIVSHKTLGNEMHKNAIIESNSAYRETFIFPAGITLAIPEIRLEVSEDLPPWKKGVTNE